MYCDNLHVPMYSVSGKHSYGRSTIDKLVRLFRHAFSPYHVDEYCRLAVTLRLLFSPFFLSFLTRSSYCHSIRPRPKSHYRGSTIYTQTRPPSIEDHGSRERRKIMRGIECFSLPSPPKSPLALYHLSAQKGSKRRSNFACKTGKKTRQQKIQTYDFSSS